MYAEKRNYLNDYTWRYDLVNNWFSEKQGIDLLEQAMIADLCAGDWWMAKFCRRYYGCDIEPRAEPDEHWIRRVQTAPDHVFVRYLKPKFKADIVGEKILTVFWYAGRAWLENIKDNKELYKSEKAIESKTLDDSIFEMLEVCDWFVLEWTSTYVDWFISKYKFDIDEADFSRWIRAEQGEDWTRDRKFYIFDMRK